MNWLVGNGVNELGHSYALVLHLLVHLFLVRAGCACPYYCYNYYYKTISRVTKIVEFYLVFYGHSHLCLLGLT